MTFTVKDSGKRMTFDSGMERDTQEGKTLYHLVLSGPMFDRWATHLTLGASKYDEDNWMKAEGEAELKRFKASAVRHFRQWYRGDADEDHASAVFFNINGAEYVQAKMDLAEYNDRAGISSPIDSVVVDTTPVPFVVEGDDFELEQDRFGDITHSRSPSVVNGETVYGQPFAAIEQFDRAYRKTATGTHDRYVGDWNTPPQNVGFWRIPAAEQVAYFIDGMGNVAGQTESPREFQNVKDMIDSRELVPNRFVAVRGM